MEVIAELATSVPDLVAARDRLLASLAGPMADGRLAWTPALEPKTWRDLVEAVRLGVLTPEQARRFVNLPQAHPGLLHRLAHLRWQRGGIF
ncbi:MAG: hypothetical protein ACYDCB_09330 [Candidatus Dormibacteria bacterium]